MQARIALAEYSILVLISTRVDVPLHLLSQLYDYCLLLRETQLRPDGLETRVSFQEQRPKYLGIIQLINVFSQQGGIALLETVPNS